MASVAGFRWWTASDVPKDLMFQLWLKVSDLVKIERELLKKNIKGPGVASVVVVFTLDKPKELKFQLWLRLSVNCSKKY